MNNLRIKTLGKKKKNKNKIKFQPHAECTYITFFITFFWHKIVIGVPFRTLKYIIIDDL